MVKNVKPNHAGVQVTVVCIVLHHRTSLSNNDIKKSFQLDGSTGLLVYLPEGTAAN